MQQTPDKPPHKASARQDLKKVLDVSDESITEAAKKVDNPKHSGVEPDSPRRIMRFHNISENELRSLSAINDATAGVYALMAAITTFLIDIGKDIVLSEGGAPDSAVPVLGYIVPLLILVLLILSVIVWRIRKARNSILEIIKIGSMPEEARIPKQIPNRFVRAWYCLTNSDLQP